MQSKGHVKWRRPPAPLSLNTKCGRIIYGFAGLKNRNISGGGGGGGVRSEEENGVGGGGYWSLQSVNVCQAINTVRLWRPASFICRPLGGH